jgi:hypothetical protein
MMTEQFLDGSKQHQVTSELINLTAVQTALFECGLLTYLSSNLPDNGHLVVKTTTAFCSSIFLSLPKTLHILLVLIHKLKPIEFAFQIRMLQWLDSLTEMSPNVIEIGLMRNYPQIEDLNVTRLSGVPLGKFIKKIISKYDLDPNLASRQMRTKTIGAFRYLIKEKTSPTMRKSIIKLKINFGKRTLEFLFNNLE